MKKATTKKKKPPTPKTDFHKNRQSVSHEKLTWKAGTMIYPLPAVMVSCGNKEAVRNIITVAWTGITCTEPPQCYISLRPHRYSYGIIKQTREFCINITSADLSFATDWCGVKSGKDIDKFKEMGLTPVPAKFISAPMIAESPINLECRVTQILPLGSHDMFLAEILAIHVTQKYVNPITNALNLETVPLLAFSHGKYYQLGAFKGKFGFSVEKKTKKKRRKQ